MPTTELLFRADAYRMTASSPVLEITGAGIVIAESLFYPAGGGQPGDTGSLSWAGGSCRVTDAIKGEGGTVVLMIDGPAPPAGSTVQQALDWDRRFAHMRMHTALHLLSVVVPLPVTGGAITAEKGRLDFNMPEAPEDRDQIEDELNRLIALNFAVAERWITDAELEAQPDLVKTMSVRPPVGSGRVRLIRIGSDDQQIDLQPCGGTHVARTGEIDRVRLGKIEKKGRQNRRVHLHFA